ncbi:hypothetical protein GOODEAATRI_028039, partial [Goodea atripinnis]
LELYSLDGNSSEPVRIFSPHELFSALHYSGTRHTCKLFDYVTNRCLCLFPAEKCKCKEQTLTNSKLFCTMNYAYGSHAEVEAEVQKVLSHNTKLKIQRGWVTLYPESWTTRGCTCPILNPGQTRSDKMKPIN